MNEQRIISDGQLIEVLSSLEKQIARAANRKTELEVAESGFGKENIHSDKIERITGSIITSFEDNEIGLDSVLVLTQALLKSLRFISEDLNNEDLGEVRTELINTTINAVDRDLQLLKKSRNQEKYLS